MVAPNRGSRTYQRIYAVARRVPRGRVATYGQIAHIAGIGRGARQVGYALHALPAGTTLPWHRVINAKGEVSLRADGSGAITQRIRLEQEGVRFNARGRVALSKFGWQPAPKQSALGDGRKRLS
jgi:methylated-DNA-protein-cysteine methyltransferase related protein